MAPPPRPSICRPRPDARKHVDQRDRKQYYLRKSQHDVKHDRHHKNQPERMAPAEIDLLARPEAPRAHHQKSAETDEQQPRNRNPPRLHGNPLEEVHRRRQQSRRCGNRHSYEILPIRPARISRLRIVADIESRQPRDPANQKQEADETLQPATRCWRSCGLIVSGRK